MRYRVRYFGGRLIAVGQNGIIATSATGSSWTKFTNTGTTNWLNDVAFVDGTWFAFGFNGTVLASTVEAPASGPAGSSGRISLSCKVGLVAPRPPFHAERSDPRRPECLLRRSARRHWSPRDTTRRNESESRPQPSAFRTVVTS